MDRSAIEAITEQPTLVDINKHLKEAGLPVITVPDNSTLKSLEQHLPARTRFRGEMSTASLKDFSNYVEAHSQKHSACFINADQMSATVLFNFGNHDKPGHCDNTATLSLKKTVPYKSVLYINNRSMNQKEFSEWLEDWAHCVMAIDENDEPLDLKKAIQSIRKLTVETSQEVHHEESNFRAKRSALETVEAKSKGNTLPAYITFRTSPYDNFRDYVINLRVSILNGGSAPKIIPRIVALETLQQDIAKEFQDKVDQEIKGFMKTYIGQFTA